MTTEQLGIKITTKDGSVEWIDPIVNVQIYNGYNNYLYKPEELKNIDKLELYVVGSEDGS